MELREVYKLNAYLVLYFCHRHDIKTKFSQDLPMENTYIPCFYMLHKHEEKLELEESGF